jgi:hypothetical protein
MLINGYSVPINPDDDDLTHLVMHKGAGQSVESDLHIR